MGGGGVLRWAEAREDLAIQRVVVLQALHEMRRRNRRYRSTAICANHR
jgi:hypothetical protein